MSTESDLDISADSPLQLNVQNVAIVTVIAVLSMVALCMIVVITGLYIQKRKQKTALNETMTEAIADLQSTSIDNPVYGGNLHLSLVHFTTTITSSKFILMCEA